MKGGDVMKKFHISILIALIVLAVTSTVFAASLAIKCPSVIASKALKTFALSKDKYVCFKSTADAKKAGYKSETSVKKAWKAVTTFSGLVNKTTDPFTITASQWRMNWTHPDSNDYFAIVVYDAAKNEYKKLIVSTIGATSDSSSYYGAGSFYLDISAGSDWTATVEEYK